MQKTVFLKTAVKIVIAAFMLAAFFCILTACEGSSQQFHVNYIAGDGGSISGETNQIVKCGGDAASVEAIPDTGYYFVKWMDGKTTATRHDKNIQSFISVIAVFEPIINGVNYTIDVGGTINGVANQSVPYGADAEAVTAVANKGYIFIEWSDGNTNATRQDKNITSVQNIKAIFERGKHFIFQYDHATENNTESEITLLHNKLEQLQFPVPKREHFVFDGWFLDPIFNTRVTDTIGKLSIGNEVIDSDYEYLFAKWTGTADHTYKILMVFVTEIQATLTTVDGVSADINYKMTEVEKQICELATFQFSSFLNLWFAGVINFDVDVFFTTEPIGVESFSSGMSSLGKRDYSVNANNIPEVYGLLKNYRSIITSFGLRDYDRLFHDSSGSASNKYANVKLDSFIGAFVINKEPLENLLNLENINWDTFIDTYLHEFAHTVEVAASYNSNVYEYHEAISQYVEKSVKNTGGWSTETLFELTKLFLRDELIIDGERINGIPIEFWKGEINVLINYVSNVVDGWSGGKIVLAGETEGDDALVMTIPYGSDITVEAIPFEGLRFIGWSDGVTTAIRHDANIISLLTVTAIFEKVSG